MWNKRTDEGHNANLGPQPVTENPQVRSFNPQRHEPAQPSPAKQVAVIGPSMNIKGEIRTREELFVNGEVEGLLESHSLLTVGANGKVKANIKAREVVVYGSVRGNVDVAEKIAIRDNGSVIGDIKTSGISIDDGAYFKGSIDISRPEPKPAAKPVRMEEPTSV